MISYNEYREICCDGHLIRYFKNKKLINMKPITIYIELVANKKS